MTSAASFGSALSRVYALEREGAVDDLIHLLNNPLERNGLTLREAAAAALGRMGAIQAGEPLVTAASDDSAEVRFSAVYALGRIGYEGGLPALVEALRDESVHVRRAAAFGLGRLGSSAAIPALREALESPDGWTRFYAAEALAAMYDDQLPRRLPALVKRESLPWWSRRRRHWRRLQKLATTDTG
jgi:HEAT repeat protein